MYKITFSSNLTIFDYTETRFGHHEGKLVKYDNKTLAIGGRLAATVEELDYIKCSWTEHTMSPVNNYNILNYFSALSIDKSLYIFGKLRLQKKIIKDNTGGSRSDDYLDIPAWLHDVLQWNGFVWTTLENKICTKQAHHTTVVYSGAIYHVGGQHKFKNGIWTELYNG